MSATLEMDAGPGRFGRVAVVINTSSGGVDVRAPARLTSILAAHGLEVEPRLAVARSVNAVLDEVLAERPDTLVVLAGDGTLACSADRCGPGGPRLMALPGGTMNMLAHELNGRRAWPEALEALLKTGRPMEASCGSVGRRRFYVNAILGSPALLADAREAIRSGKLHLAVLRARRAWLRAFKGRLRFSLDGGPKRKAGALSLICPMVSRELRSDLGLEAAALDPRGALDLFRLGMGALVGGWRHDPSVRVQVVRRASAWARGRLPAILDGEPHRLDSPADIAFHPNAFSAWATSDAPALSLAAPAAGSEEARADQVPEPPSADRILLPVG